MRRLRRPAHSRSRSSRQPAASAAQRRCRGAASIAASRLDRAAARRPAQDRQQHHAGVQRGAHRRCAVRRTRSGVVDGRRRAERDPTPARRPEAARARAQCPRARCRQGPVGRRAGRSVAAAGAAARDRARGLHRDDGGGCQWRRQDHQHRQAGLPSGRRRGKRCCWPRPTRFAPRRASNSRCGPTGSAPRAAPSRSSASKVATRPRSPTTPWWPAARAAATW